MPAPYDNVFLSFFFVFVRVVAVVNAMPVLSNQTVLRPVRLAIAFWVSLVILGPTLGLNEWQQGRPLPAVVGTYEGVLHFAVAVAAEMVIGLVLGFIGQMLVNSITLAGEIIGQQSGFSAASVLDPITGQDIFLMATIKIWFATLIFLAIGGPELIFSALADSFRLIGPGEGVSLLRLGEVGYKIFNYSDGTRMAMASIMYKVGVQIAAPMVGAMILISVAEAFIARTVPQLNILVVGFAVRIVIGLYLLYWMMRFTVEKFELFLGQYTQYAEAALNRLAGS